jgi:hypothetical protein
VNPERYSGLSDELVDAVVEGFKFVGPDFVIIRLDDGTEMKITLNCEVFKAKDSQGTGPKYHTNINFNVAVKTPPGRTIKLPKSIFGQQQPPSKPKDTRQIA